MLRPSAALREALAARQIPRYALEIVLNHAAVPENGAHQIHVLPAQLVKIIMQIPKLQAVRFHAFQIVRFRAPEYVVSLVFPIKL